MDEYVMTTHIITRLRNRVKMACYICDRPLKKGDRIISTRKKRYHKSCFEATQY